jgi:hypothetical protein
MKKLMCVLLSVSLIISSCVFAYAKGPKHKDDKKSDSQGTKINIQITIEENNIKDQIKKAYKDIGKLKKLAKDMRKLREKRNDRKPMIFIDGDEIDAEVPPVIKYGRTLVPVRAIMNGLKADVDWNAESRTVTVTKAVYNEVYGMEKRVIEIKLGSDILKVNGVEYKTDAPAEIINNRTMVPLRIISQLLNLDVIWDPESQAVIITKTETYVALPITPTPSPTAAPSTIPATATPQPTETPSTVPATETVPPTTTPTTEPTVTPVPSTTPIPSSAT